MIVFAIVILIAGILLMAAPKLVYEITQSWKSNSDSEPSNYYMILSRVQGVILTIVGIVLIFY